MYSQANIRAGEDCGLFERSRPRSLTLKRCCGKRMGRRTVTFASGGKVFAPGCARESVPEKPAGARRTPTTQVAQKPGHTAATPPEPSLSRGRSVSKKRSIRGKSNRGSTLRQPCKHHLRDTCTPSCCVHWHPPECRFHQNDAGCVKLETRVCSRTGRLMNNQFKKTQQRATS